MLLSHCSSWDSIRPGGECSRGPSSAEGQSAWSQQCIPKGVGTSQLHLTAAGQLPQLLANAGLTSGKAWSFSSVKEPSHPPLPSQLSTPHSVWSLACSFPLPPFQSGPTPARSVVPDHVQGSTDNQITTTFKNKNEKRNSELPGEATLHHTLSQNRVML